MTMKGTDFLKVQHHFQIHHFNLSLKSKPQLFTVMGQYGNSYFKKLVYLQKAGIGPDREVELGCVGDEEDVAVYVDRRSCRPEEQRENVA